MARLLGAFTGLSSHALHACALTAIFTAPSSRTTVTVRPGPAPADSDAGRRVADQAAHAADAAKRGARYWHFTVNQLGIQDMEAQIERIHTTKTAELGFNGKGLVNGPLASGFLPAPTAATLEAALGQVLRPLHHLLFSCSFSARIEGDSIGVQLQRLTCTPMHAWLLVLVGVAAKHPVLIMATLLKGRSHRCACMDHVDTW